MKELSKKESIEKQIERIIWLTLDINTTNATNYQAKKKQAILMLKTLFENKIKPMAEKIKMDKTVRQLAFQSIIHLDALGNDNFNKEKRAYEIIDALGDLINIPSHE